GIKTESSALTKSLGLGTREGGFEQHKKERDEYRRNRSNEIKEIASKGEQKKVRELEASHQNLLEDGNAHAIQQIENQLKMAEVYRSDAAAELRADPTNLAKKARAKETSEVVKELRDQRSAIKNGEMFFKESTKELFDYREQTIGMNDKGELDVKLNGSLSENSLRGIATAAQKAEDASKASPADTSLANKAKIARAAHYAALATQAQADADKAEKESKKNPTDTVLQAKATAAKAHAATAKSLAVMDQGIVAGLKAAAGATAAEIEALAKAKDAALRSVDKIKNGLAGRAINNLEDTDMPEAKHAVHHAERASAAKYVKNNLKTDTSTFGGKVVRVARFIAAPITGDSEKARARTAHEITMNNKLDSGTGGKGGGGH
ncbi:MAG: hypothetical protein AAB895_01130, partial [Patescibacteria group bacterium]